MEEFRVEGSTDVKNQSDAVQWQLCTEKIAGTEAWRNTFDFGVCINQCNSTWCPQPASQYMTADKAASCAAQVGVDWKKISDCVASEGTDLQQASEQRYLTECPGCPGPTVHINGGYAGHHPTVDPILAQICGNYTGTKPPGCSGLPPRAS